MDNSSKQVMEIAPVDNTNKIWPDNRRFDSMERLMNDGNVLLLFFKRKQGNSLCQIIIKLVNIFMTFWKDYLETSKFKPEKAIGLIHIPYRERRAAIKSVGLYFANNQIANLE